MSSPTALLQHLRQLSADGEHQERTDRELLQRFATQHDQAAFAVLLRRHGPMVLRVCQGVLAQTPDAEDAFQATFLVLAKKASSVRWQGSAAGWLHAVARNVALRLRRAALRRQKHEQQAIPPAPADPLDDLTLREALRRHPACWRRAVCDTG